MGAANRLCAVGAALCFGVGSPANAAEKTPRPPSGWLVWMDYDSNLQAESLGARPRRISRAFTFVWDWDIRHDGKSVVYVASPGIQFFSARSARVYLFEHRLKEPQRQLIFGAYEKTDADFSSVGEEAFTVDSLPSNKLLLTTSWWDFYTSQTVVALYDPATKKARALVQTDKLAPLLRKRAQRFPSLSRDEKTLVYVATSPVNTGTDAYFSEKDWNSYLVAYDLETHASRILLTARRDISDVRISPNGRFCVWSQAMNDEPYAPRQLMRCDLRTGEIKPLTRPQGETDSAPVWSPDGRHILWIRRKIKSKTPQQSTKWALMNADGTHQRPIRWGRTTGSVRWIAEIEPASWKAPPAAPAKK